MHVIDETTSTPDTSPSNKGNNWGVSLYPTKDKSGLIISIKLAIPKEMASETVQLAQKAREIEEKSLLMKLGL